MRRTLALLVPLLLVVVAVSLTAATVAQPTPGDGQAPLVTSYENSSNHLTIPEDEVRGTGTATVGLDAGLAVGIGGRDLQTTHQMETFRQRFDAAETDANRSAAYDAILTALEDRADALREHNADMNGAYADGSISAESFLRERAVVVAEASRLQGSISELRAVESETLGFELSDQQQSRLRVVSLELDFVRGPVAEGVAGLATDGSSPQSVYVENSTTGHVIAHLDGDTYLREAYLGAEYDPTATDQFQTGNESTLANARQRGLELYSHTTSTSTEQFGSTYQFNGVFDGGQITAYLDGGTGNAFGERQRVNASQLPVAESLSTTNDSVTMYANATFPTGPTEVTLVDSETGVPIDGTVTVDDSHVGRTGADGSLWVIEPRDGGQVRASTDETNLTASLSGG